jgi:hypothetical protein
MFKFTSKTYICLSIFLILPPPERFALSGIPDIIRITGHQRGVVVIIIPVPPFGISALNVSPEHFIGKLIWI